MPWPTTPDPKLKAPFFFGPVYLELTYVFPMTKAEIAKHVEHVADDSFIIHKTTRPDIDNAAKLLIDVLTNAIFWHDDAQITDLRIRKRAGSSPRIEVVIRESEPCMVGAPVATGLVS